MTEREDKTPVAPSGAAEEQEILLDSPIVESEDEPGAVDAPGVSGSKEPDEAAVESTPVVEEDAVEPVPPVEEAIAGNRRPPPMPTLRRGYPKSPRARRRLGRKRKHCPRPPLAVSLRPPSILLPGRKKSRKKNGP